MKNIMAFLFAIGVLGVHGRTYSSLNDVREIRTVAATNLVAALDEAAEVIAACDWRGDNVSTCTLEVVSCVISNVSSFVANTNNLNEMLAVFGGKVRVLNVLQFMCGNRAIPLSREVFLSVSRDLGRYPISNMDEMLENFRLNYRNAHTNEPSYNLSTEWQSGVCLISNLGVLNQRVRSFRKDFLRSLSPFAMTYYYSVSPDLAVSFTNDFISAASLCADEVLFLFEP